MQRFSIKENLELVKPVLLQDMLPFSRILHLFVIKSVVPRSGKRGEAGFLDLVLMEHLIKGKRVNLPKLMIQHMIHVVSRINHDLPYGMSISKVLKYFKVPLCETLQDKNSEMDFFRKPFLKKVELEFCEGVWWLGKGATRRRDPVMHPEPVEVDKVPEENDEVVVEDIPVESSKVTSALRIDPLTAESADARAAKITELEKNWHWQGA
ncbi:hypothetical protein Dimus_008847 [Dionaea muscipula]